MLSQNYKRIFNSSLLSAPGRIAPLQRRSFSTRMNIRMSHYDVLGIKNTASPLEVKKAYYGKVKCCHPDHNTAPSAEEDFKIVAKAYETLKDPGLRGIYDNNLKAGTQFANEYTNSYNAHAYNDFHGSRRSGPVNTEDEAFCYSSSWSKANDHQRSRYYSQAYTSTPAEEKDDTLLGKVAVVIAMFILIEMWRVTHKKTHSQGIIQAGGPISVGQMDFETHTGWGRDDVMTPEKLHAEMKKKGFRIEYHDAKPNNGHEKKEKRTSFRRDKKIENMDHFLAKHQFTIKKSVAPSAVNNIMGDNVAVIANDVSN